MDCNLSPLELKIQSEFGIIVKKFKILHHGWDMDGYGYIVKGERGNLLVLTNHSKPYIETKLSLHDKIKEYENIIQDTKIALDMIK
jgi:hypothetical protein